MKKWSIVILTLFLLLSPITVFCESNITAPIIDITFKAKITKLLEEREINRDDGSKSIQQNLQMVGLENQWKDKTIESYGVSDIDVPSAHTYNVGDIVLVSAVQNNTGSTDFYVLDFIRTKYLYLLTFIFVLVVILIGRMKGVKSLISLVVSFFVIIGFIVPRIVAGDSPLLVGILGSLAILAAIIYLTEGWNRKSHIALMCVLVSLLVTFGLSWIFSSLTRLTGMAQEETIFLLGTNNGQINFRGLLLAGILIGAVGVLDDIIIGQIEAVKQIKKANPALDHSAVYKASYKIGNTHLGTMVNTLFLTYAGASLPLLLLAHFGNAGVVSFEQIINNELIATEIVRTLVGSIGVALAMPISTFLATILIRPESN